MSARTPSSLNVPANAVFRRATPDDVLALVPLINDAYDLLEHHIFPKSRRTDRHDITQYLREMTVAEIDGRIVGCIHINLSGDPAHYGLLAVDVTLHRSGLGSMLVHLAEERAKDAGKSRIGIETVRQAGLVPFYEARGYVTTNEHDGQDWNGGADWGASSPWQMVDMEKEL